MDTKKTVDLAQRTKIDQKGKNEWDNAYKLEGTSVLWSEPPVPFIQEQAVDIFKKCNPQEVLDLPCGDGRNTLPLAQAFPRVMAADVSSRAVKIARENLEKKNIRNCSYQDADIFHTPWDNNSFDSILCWGTLGHLARPVLALKELIRILKPGGRLIAGFFSINDPMKGVNMVEIAPNEFMYDNRFFYRFYTPSDLITIAGELSEKASEVRTTQWEEPPHKGFREYTHMHESHALILKK